MEMGKDSYEVYGWSSKIFWKFETIWVVVERFTKLAYFILSQQTVICNNWIRCM